MQKVTHWAELAEHHPGVLMLCSDNDISLLPGWLEQLTEAFDASGASGLDLCFQREGGDDPFFEARTMRPNFSALSSPVSPLSSPAARTSVPRARAQAFPYNSGFFMQRGSVRLGAFWREVARRTERERPPLGVSGTPFDRQPTPFSSRPDRLRPACANALFLPHMPLCARPRAARPIPAALQDQAIVNALLNVRHAGGLRCAAPLDVRHGHFQARLVHGGPAIPPAERLHSLQVHHATASGGAENKTRTLDALLDAWLAAHNRTWEQLGLVAGESWHGAVATEL